MSQPFELVDAAPEQVKVPLLPVRIFQVFVSPAKLFDTLKARPVWIDALVVLVAIGVASQIFIPEDIRRAAIETQMEQFVPADTDPAEFDAQVDQALQQPPVFQYAVGILGSPVFLLLLSLILLVAFNVVMGGEAQYKQLFSATVHACYVYMVGGLVVLGLMLMGSEQMVLTPGVFLPASSEGLFADLLNAINIFSVWTCVTLGIAISRIYPKRSVVGGAGFLLVFYLILIGGMTGLGRMIRGG